uniref:Uncharacterized protein n=1 Tax=Ditylenchus dipsaci TaxID=166011 RepID=A0A915EK27_9BILA
MQTLNSNSTLLVNVTSAIAAGVAAGQGFESNETEVSSVFDDPVLAVFQSYPNPSDGGETGSKGAIRSGKSGVQGVGEKTGNKIVAESILGQMKVQIDGKYFTMQNRVPLLLLANSLLHTNSRLLVCRIVSVF